MHIRIQPAAASAVVLLLALSACQRGAPAPEPDPVVTLGPENIARVEERELRTGPLISGRLEPRESATLRAEVPGEVLEVNVEAGQEVKEGELLAKLDPASAPVALDAARAALRSAQRSLELAKLEEDRVRELAEAGAIAEQELDRAMAESARAAAQVDQAEAQLAEAREQVARTEVFAPFTGVVSDRAVNAGDLVQPGTPLFTIVDPSSLRLEAAVPAEERTHIEIGAPVQFSVAGYNGRIAGEVERINPILDPTTGQLRVFVTVPNAGDTALLGGLYAEGRIAAETVKAPSVPVSALNEETNPPTVLRVSGQQLERVPVRLGLVDEVAERVQVLEGLQPGALVVTGDVRDLPAGTKVKLMRPQASEPEQPSVGGGAREGAED